MKPTTEKPDARALELINAELDGELDDAERRELEQILEQSATARQARAELQVLFNVLGSMPAEDPPRSLLAAFEGGTRHAPRRRFAGWFLPFQLGPVGVGLAAGLLLTVAAYELTSPVSGLDAHQAVGTIGANRARALDSITLDGPDVSGEIVLSAGAGGLVVTVELDAQGESEVAVDIAGSGLRLEGLGFGDARNAAGTGSVGLAGGRLTVSDRGRQSFSMVLSRPEGLADTHLTLEVSAGGKTVYAGELRG